MVWRGGSACFCVRSRPGNWVHISAELYQGAYRTAFLSAWSSRSASAIHMQMLLIRHYTFARLDVFSATVSAEGASARPPFLRLCRQRARLRALPFCDCVGRGRVCAPFLIHPL